MVDVFLTFFFGLSIMEQIYLICAVVGGSGFLLQVVSLALGADMDMDADVDVDVHVHGAGFQFISLQSLTAFFLMFGLVGFALLREHASDTFWSVVWATGSGITSLLLVSAVFAFFKSMKSSGNIKLENAIGQEGSVYLTIPEEGTGQVKVNVNGSLKIFDAASANKEEIKSEEAIKVTSIRADILIVEKL